MKNLCLFAGFDRANTIQDYVLYYVKSLAKFCDVYYLADCPMPEHELNKLAPYVKKAYAYRHNRYDFGSWAELIDKIGWYEIKKYDNLIICNDSCYGPLFDLEHIFNEMNQKETDFWGITDNNDRNYHLQSYFISFKKNVLENRPFQDFFKTIEKQDACMDVVWKYEIELSRLLLKNNFKCRSYITIDRKKYPANLTLYPFTLINKCKMPFLKVRLVFSPEFINWHNFFSLIIWKRIVSKTNYDINLIKKHLDCYSYEPKFIAALYVKIKKIILSFIQNKRLYTPKSNELNINYPEIDYLNIKKVSVVLCTFNGEKYLREQLDSIVNQSYPLKELIIQDDCSTDSTLDIVKEYQKRYPIIKLYVNKENKGVNENFFSAMNKAEGDYIAISDQDDIWELDKINKQINTIGDSLLCFGRSRHFDSTNGSIIREDNATPKYSLTRYIFLNMISGHLMLINSKLLKLMPFRDNLRLYDYYLGLTAAAHDSIAFCNEIVCNHRIHNNNITFNHENIRPKKIPFRFFYVITSSLLIRKRLRKRVNVYFSTVHEFISQTKVETEDIKNAKEIALLMSNTSFISTIKAMKFCISNKDKILEDESNSTILLFKSAFFPFQCYHLFNY